jgi:ubiquitin thioesterase OTU1
MRIRIRGPSGQSTATLPDDATVANLKTKIAEATGLTQFDVRFGYPPEPLAILDFPAESRLSDWNIKLDGDTLIVSNVAPPPATAGTAPAAPAAPAEPGSSNTAPAPKPTDPLDEPPELAMSSHAATMVLRIMPDDNSCLFRAFNSAYFGAMDNMHELRSIIAQTIQAQPEKYSDAVLGRSRDDYCRWIQTTDAWGGAIELNILSQHFEIEICSIDVQTLRIDRFNEAAAKRCVLVYSGIHYDVVALSPSDPPFEKAYAPPDFDTKVFEKADEEVLEYAVALCESLQDRHYFTDTASFTIRCNVCGGTFAGEKGATEHATATGHYDFGEV